VKNRHVRKLAVAVALCGSLLSSAAQAKTFVAVLWPMFGPLPAIGLVELVAEIKMMPDVEVETYVHQAWPSLVEDLARQAPGTHTVVIGYSLGANSTVFVANEAKNIDLIIALQPSMLSWNPPLTGKVGRMIEIYNPNPWLTWGGMGSKKLIGDNIEYITNTDSHPGAQFNSEFRDLAKSEIAKFTARDRLQGDRVETAQAALPKPAEPAPPAQPARPAGLAFAEEQPASQQKDSAAKGHSQIAKITQSELPKLSKPAVPDHVAQERPKPGPKEASRDAASERTAFLDHLSSSVKAGDLSAESGLTLAAMTDYAARTYGVSPTAEDAGGLQRVGWAER
jgi:hypothetical protein